MENPEEKRVSFYTQFFDKEVPQASYGAIINAVLSLIGGVASWFVLYDPEKPGTGAVALVGSIISIIVAAVSGVFAFFIFRRSRVAIVLMIAFIAVLQLFNWLVGHSLQGTLPFIIVTAFLLLGRQKDVSRSCGASARSRERGLTSRWSRPRAGRMTASW